MSDKIRIHMLHCGMVRTTRWLPFNNDHVSMARVAGLFVPEKDWEWLPVSCYYIEHPKGKILVDTAWSRRMSPDGVEDKRAQIRELGYFLYRINQGFTPEGQTVDEQLKAMGVRTADLDYVLLTHLDCDHACGLHQVADAKRILVSEEEMKYANSVLPTHFDNIVRYKKRWWEDVPVTLFAYNGKEGPFRRSFDLFEDGTVQLINIPGHCAGLSAVKITGKDGRFVLLDADGAYSAKNWEEMIPSGIAANRVDQMKSLEWIREMSMSDKCIESLATHDPNVKPHTVEIEL
ncbi:MAG: N-acyl homoserine lactonase family protein [Clostridiales bacterium]|nr:N-acyl homoserine lactonase family protein [Clostridiales bacterium]